MAFKCFLSVVFVTLVWLQKRFLCKIYMLLMLGCATFITLYSLSRRPCTKQMASEDVMSGTCTRQKIFLNDMVLLHAMLTVVARTDEFRHTHHSDTLCLDICSFPSMYSLITHELAILLEQQRIKFTSTDMRRLQQKSNPTVVRGYASI